jgi:hypothetical protein
MSPPPKPPRKSSPGTEPAPAKRPWQPPRIRTGHLFESNSLACGKSAPGLDQCEQNPTTS